tara:strand:+ start:98 stop:703 length:606 start_codon:yes stop_codon:yes gene_type:complete
MKNNSIFETTSLKKTLLFFTSILIFLSISQCNIYKKTDARKNPTNAKERVQKNLEEGKRIKFSDITNRGTGKFEFASSNEMWRATIDILDFVPLANADYGGGIIITDWYNASDTKNSSIKIMIQFLSNDIRPDGIKITIYNKDCTNTNGISSCNTTKNDGKIADELRVAILKQASILKTISTKKKVAKFRKDRKGTPGVKD